MDWLYVTFPVSGVRTWLWLPPLAAFAVSFFTSMVGVSGAFLLLPFQMSVLHFTSPAVSATNLVFNLVATPGGVYRYVQEGRMAWPLAAVIAAGSLPGMAIGYLARVWYLPDPRAFKLFVASVLLYLAARLLSDRWPRLGRGGPRPLAAPRFEPPHAAPLCTGVTCACRTGARVGARNRFLTGLDQRAGLPLGGQTYRFSVPRLLALALGVGVVGGIYGIGGGAIMAPFCVAVLGLPIHAVAGATLTATLASSLFGLVLYSTMPAPAAIAVRPDWALGALLGLGGLAGMYLGAMLQKYISQRILKACLAAVLLLLALQYGVQSFGH